MDLAYRDGDGSAGSRLLRLADVRPWPVVKQGAPLAGTVLAGSAIAYLGIKMTIPPPMPDAAIHGHYTPGDVVGEAFPFGFAVAALYVCGRIAFQVYLDARKII